MSEVDVVASAAFRFDALGRGFAVVGSLDEHRRGLPASMMHPEASKTHRIKPS